MSTNRREAIKRTAVLMGGLIFAPSAVSVLKGCRARPGSWNPEFFSREQAELIRTLSDVIIPETDTPGAVEAGVPAFIEEMITTGYNDDERQQFLSGLEGLNQLAEDLYGSSFVDLDPDTQLQFADGQNREAVSAEHTDGGGTPFFLVLKELVVLGYFTSEIGATQALRYEKVPGRYEPCIPFEEVGRTWATA